jgi:hypothetical protein
MLRLTIAALLLFCCTRVVGPISSWTGSTSSRVAVHSRKINRTVVLEVGTRAAKIVRPTALRFRDFEVALAPTPITFQVNGQNHFVEMWPEHRHAFFRQTLPLALDPGH